MNWVQGCGKQTCCRIPVTRACGAAQVCAVLPGAPHNNSLTTCQRTSHAPLRPCGDRRGLMFRHTRMPRSAPTFVEFLVRDVLVGAARTATICGRWRSRNCSFPFLLDLVLYWFPVYASCSLFEDRYKLDQLATSARPLPLSARTF